MIGIATLDYKDGNNGGGLLSGLVNFVQTFETQQKTVTCLRSLVTGQPVSVAGSSTLPGLNNVGSANGLVGTLTQCQSECLPGTPEQLQARMTLDRMVEASKKVLGFGTSLPTVPIFSCPLPDALNLTPNQFDAFVEKPVHL